MSGRAAYWLARELAAPQIDRATDAVKLARDGRDSARTFYRGATELRAFGRRSETSVRGEIWHGAGDRKLAIDQLTADWSAFAAELDAAQANGCAAATDLIRVTAPAIAAWRSFVEHERASVLAPWVTEWSVFESWWARLRGFREQAKAAGIVLAAPDLVPLPKTIWQRAETGTGSQVDVWISALKTVILASMTLVGAVGFYSVVREFSRRTLSEKPRE